MWWNAVDNRDVGVLILRLAVGGLLLVHGINKLLDFQTTMAWMSADLVAYHMPAFFAYGVIIGEVVAPVMLICGFFTRLAGLIIVVNIIFAIVLVRHGSSVFLTFNSPFGGWTLQPESFFLLTGLSLIFLGGGKYAVNSY